MQTEEEYTRAVAGEGKYWDDFVADWLLRGKMPGSIDFRLAFTQHRYESGWRPFCLGIAGLNFRMREIRYVLDTAAARPGTRVLDLGCGAGWLSLELARLGVHVTGIDISPTNLALGRYMAANNARNFPYLYQNFAGLPCRLDDFGSVEYVYGDLNKVSLPAQEYDMVVVADSLHHISNMERLVEEVRRTLKPGGVFVGMDHAFATRQTQIFNGIAAPWVNDFYGWVTAEDPSWLYDTVIEAGDQRDLGVLNIDYSSAPVPGFEQFAEQLFADLLDVVRSEIPAEQWNQAESERSEDGAKGDGETKESPFEDISAERLADVLLDNFEASNFTTICPFVQAALDIPPFRTEKERLFQHYLSTLLIEFGERAILKGEAVGQWFTFSLRPERPTGIKPVNPFTISQASTEGWSGARLAVGTMTRYIQHLESEIERKNAALASSQQYQRRLEEELLAARKPRLPWKRSFKP